MDFDISRVILSRIQFACKSSTMKAERPALEELLMKSFYTLFLNDHIFHYKVPYVQ